MKKAKIEENNICFIEATEDLSDGIADFYEAKNKIIDAYLRLVKICREHGHCKFTVPYEYCAFCHYLSGDLEETDKTIYRIVGVDLLDPCVNKFVLMDKEIDDVNGPKIIVDDDHIDYGYERLGKLFKDYIENWQ